MAWKKKWGYKEGGFYTREGSQAFNPSSIFSVGELKCDFRQGSKVQGPMSSSNLIG